jgi:hypothetical protein
MGLHPASQATSNAVVSTDPHARCAPRPMPRAASHDHGSCWLTRNVNGLAGKRRQHARVEAALGDEPHAARVGQIVQVPRVELARIHRHHHVRPHTGGEERAQRRVDGNHEARPSIAFNIARFWSSDGPAPTTMAGTPVKAPFSAATSPSARSPEGSPAS